MLKLRYSKQFKKDFKLSQKRGLPMQKLKALLGKLANNEPLEEKHRDHPLIGTYASFRECHIEPDWLLIYNEYKMSPTSISGGGKLLTGGELISPASLKHQEEDLSSTNLEQRCYKRKLLYLIVLCDRNFPCLGNFYILRTCKGRLLMV